MKIRRNRSVNHYPDIADIRFEGLFKAKRALSLFRLSVGTSSQNSKRFMKDTGLLRCARMGPNRTLFSLRHSYAGFALLNNGRVILMLAIQFDDSISKIERCRA